MIKMRWLTILYDDHRVPYHAFDMGRVINGCEFSVLQYKVAEHTHSTAPSGPLIEWTEWLDVPIEDAKDD